jgi:hypothetical protein
LITLFTLQEHELIGQPAPCSNQWFNVARAAVRYNEQVFSVAAVWCLRMLSTGYSSECPLEDTRPLDEQVVFGVDVVSREPAYVLFDEMSPKENGHSRQHI